MDPWFVATNTDRGPMLRECTRRHIRSIELAREESVRDSRPAWHGVLSERSFAQGRRLLVGKVAIIEDRDATIWEFLQDVRQIEVLGRRIGGHPCLRPRVFHKVGRLIGGGLVDAQADGDCRKGYRGDPSCGHGLIRHYLFS